MLEFDLFRFFVHKDRSVRPVAEKSTWRNAVEIAQYEGSLSSVVTDGRARSLGKAVPEKDFPKELDAWVRITVSYDGESPVDDAPYTSDPAAIIGYTTNESGLEIPSVRPPDDSPFWGLFEMKLKEGWSAVTKEEYMVRLESYNEDQALAVAKVQEQAAQVGEDRRKAAAKVAEKLGLTEEDLNLLREIL